MQTIDTPGPGQYGHRGTNEGPKYHLGLKTDYKGSQASNPGPGMYNIKRNVNGPVAYSFRLKTSSSMTNLKQGPGPGNYNLRSSFESIPGSKIGTERRDKILQMAGQGAPGPGAYR